MEYLREQQLSIMLGMSAVCGVLVFFSLFLKQVTKRRKHTLTLMSLEAMLLLIFDRYAYIYRGDTGKMGYVMVRLSNFAVFFFTLLIVCSFNSYICDVYKNEGGFEKLPVRLKVSRTMSFVGMALVVISQFTGLYYTFDDQNRYQRAALYPLSYALPFLILILQMTVIIQFYKRIGRNMSLSLLIFTAFPFAAAVIQFYTYGISLVNMSLAGLVVMLSVSAIVDMNRMINEGHEREVKLLKDEQKNMRILIGQTAFALAEAIDAKDGYTHGHSSRVAEYSEMIAREAGKSMSECKDIYFIALLHDVGKIGIPGSIINKPSRLDDDEFELIKSHPVKGMQILSKITRFPDLSIGAHYHHERYDGKGYPTGLKGEEIPEIARIIAVADAYDAMSSKRSYRDVMPQEKVRAEIEKGVGTQFDPEFARIMLKLIDEDEEYNMREM